MAAVVFRGTVLNSDVLARHPEMKGRERYAVTFRVSEYWKATRGEIVVVYDLAPGTDCMGAGLRIGREYLIFTSEEEAKNYRPDGEMLQVLATLRDHAKTTSHFWNCGADPLVRGRPPGRPFRTQLET